jgi:hypothetical protein
MQKCAVIAIAVFLVWLSNIELSLAQNSELACSATHGQPSAQAAATELLRAITEAYERLTKAYGDNILVSRKAEVSTPSGTQSIGEVWEGFLKQAGYPDLDARERCARLLSSAGLSDSAATGLFLMPADYDAVEDVMASLRKITRKAP